MGLNQGLVEDPLEGLAENLAGSRHMGRNRPRIRDHVVLEASVELHVANLIDQLR